MKYYQVEAQIVNPIGQFKLIKKTPTGHIYKCRLCGESEEYKGKYCIPAPRGESGLVILLDTPQFAHDCTW